MSVVTSNGNAGPLELPCVQKRQKWTIPASPTGRVPALWGKLETSFFGYPRERHAQWQAEQYLDQNTDTCKVSALHNELEVGKTKNVILQIMRVTKHKLTPKVAKRKSCITADPLARFEEFHFTAGKKSHLLKGANIICCPGDGPGEHLATDPKADWFENPYIARINSRKYAASCTQCRLHRFRTGTGAFTMAWPAYCCVPSYFSKHLPRIQLYCIENIKFKKMQDLFWACTLRSTWGSSIPIETFHTNICCMNWA